MMKLVMAAGEINTRLVDRDFKPLERLAGFETEYGFSVSQMNKPKIRDSTAEQSLGAKAYNLVKFTEDGERIYLDVGTHPECATAENPNFYDAAVQMLHGHISMAGRLARAAAGHYGISEGEEPPKGAIPQHLRLIKLIANTRDDSGNSWASHENLLARRALDPASYTQALAAQFATRIVWSGAGTVVDNSGKVGFHLSEKAQFIQDVSSGATTRLRPLVNTRDEPHADAEDYRRIHIISGESVFSPVVNALRLASSSIILRAIEDGVDFSDLELEAPVLAMKQISADPSLCSKVSMARGGAWRATEIQRAYAERAIETKSLTEQERYWGIYWLNILDRLERDPSECASVVDWVIKQRLVEKVLAQPRKNDESDYAVARRADAYYHTILPAEGLGLQRLRKGHFERSPSEDELNNGTSLPESRAKNRGGLIGAMKQRRLDFTADWSFLKARNTKIELKNPYGADPHKLQRFIDQLKLNVAVDDLVTGESVQLAA